MVDRADLSDLPSVHVVYLLASDAPDHGFDIDGTLECSFRSINAWFRDQTGADLLTWRLDTYDTGAVPLLDVTFVRSRRPARDLADVGAVDSEIRAYGLAEPGKRYLVITGGGDGQVCGQAEYPTTPLREPRRSVAAVFLRAAEGCRTGEFGVPGAPSYTEGTAMHELLHNDGVVSIAAPHSCGPTVPPYAHVCTPALWGAERVRQPALHLDPEIADVMFPFAGTTLAENVLDRNHDDYYGHGYPRVQIFGDVADSPYVTRDAA